MKYQISILPITIVVFMAVALFWMTFHEGEGADQIRQMEIEELKWEQEKLLNANDSMDSIIHALKTKADSLTSLIGKDQTRIIQLKARKHEKISRIDKFADDELYWFFTGFDTEVEEN